MTSDSGSSSTTKTIQLPAEDSAKTFGTFAGVFVPTFVILAVFVYLRLGWVVGNAGVVGGILIVLLCFGITGTTALAMSSITTNIRIGAGGPYSIISQSLGLEVGGSVGIPLYLAQTLIIALYIIGFREGWQMLFPDHPALAIDLVTFGLLCIVTWVSTRLAFRLQYVVLAIVALSFGAMIVGASTGPLAEGGVAEIQTWGEFEDASFWTVFAVFFPAATGVTAGANMSGELDDPRHSIPVGTMAAIVTALLLYVLVAVWLGGSVSPEILREQTTVIVDEAAFSPLVAAALLAVTFSSALASMVGAPRILQALGDHRILPAGEWLSARRAGGEPRNALIVTAAIVFIGLMGRELNAIAPLITMFFLVTYLMLNLVVMYEQSLDLASFRPLLRIPPAVAGVGLAGCLVAMFIINALFALVALFCVGAVYLYLTRRKPDAPFGDLRSGMFVTLAEWAARQVWELPANQDRAWKPNMLVCARDPRELRGAFLFLQDLARPRGSVKLVGLTSPEQNGDMGRALEGLVADFRERNLFANWLVMDARDFTDGVVASIQHARGTFPRPNIVFLQMPEELEAPLDYPRIVKTASQEQLGVVLYAEHPQAGLGRRQSVNIWVRDRTPDWSVSMDIGNLDLSILLGYKLRRNWNANLRFIMVVEDEAQLESARQFFEQLLEVGRLPNAELVLETGDFSEFMPRAPSADLNIFGMLSDPDLEFARKMVSETDSSCIFVRDSGNESALA